jgi:RimK family alpha-L-glutamate ligase
VAERALAGLTAERRGRPATHARPFEREQARSVVILGKPTETNRALAAAFAGLGHPAQLAEATAPPLLRQDDVAIARLDVLPSLDGIEPGLSRLSWLERQGVQVINGAPALLAAHDKLATTLLLAWAGVTQPRTAYVRESSAPSFPGPYVVKPRFGSWGRDVYLCGDETELRARLATLRNRQWFQRHGALVQSLVEPTGRDLRVVVAAGRVVGAVERHAQPGEWRTNVALGAVRRSVSPPAEARVLALRSVAALGSDLAGVDIVSDQDGRSYVLEVNGAVDFNDSYGKEIFADVASALLERAASRADADAASVEQFVPQGPDRRQQDVVFALRAAQFLGCRARFQPNVQSSTMTLSRALLRAASS